MLNYFKSVLVTLMLGLAGVAWAQSSDVKLLFVGSPQASVNILLPQLVGNSMKTPSSFSTMKDCQAAFRHIDGNDNVVFVMADLVIMTHQRRGENCVPAEFKPENIVATMTTAWHLCRKPGGKAITDPKTTVGIITILPGAAIVRDLNQRNNLNLVYVGVQSSVDLSQSLLNGDIDWGVVNPGFAEPLVKQNKLDCAYTFIPGGTDVVGKDRFVGKHFKMELDNLHCTFFVVAKTNNKETAAEINRAVSSPEFKEYLTKNNYFDIRVGAGKFTQADINKSNSYITTLLNFHSK